MAVDKLVKDPADAKLVRRYRGAAENVADLPVPYGLSGADWNQLITDAADLAELVGAEGQAEPKDEGEPADRVEQARTGAEALRERLRELV